MTVQSAPTSSRIYETFIDDANLADKLPTLVSRSPNALFLFADNLARTFLAFPNYLSLEP